MSNYSYIIANQVQTEWLANYYVDIGLEPYEAFCKLRESKYLLSLKGGKVYKFNGRKVMAMMFLILQKNKIDISQTLI